MTNKNEKYHAAVHPEPVEGQAKQLSASVLYPKGALPMIVNTVKHRMLEGQPGIGAGVGLGAPTSAALLAQAGFDFILVDYQHGEWDDAAALAAFRCISLQGAIPMARVRQNDFYTIGRVLDRGALGIIVPMSTQSPMPRPPPARCDNRRKAGDCLAVRWRFIMAATSIRGLTARSSWPCRSSRPRPSRTP